MTQEINIKRKVYGKRGFTNVVDTSFNQLVPKEKEGDKIDPDKVGTFFNYYNELFYEIRTDAITNSHLELVNRSSEYLGISYSDVVEELRVTREQNVSLKNQLFVLTGI